MSRFNPHRFAEPGTLRRLDRRDLVHFLGRFHDEFTNAGFEPHRGDWERTDFDELSRVLMNLDGNLSSDVSDALYLIHEMSTSECTDRLLTEMKSRGTCPKFREGVTPVDVALAVWLSDPALLERVHAEQEFRRRRTFHCFKGKGDDEKSRVETGTAATLKGLETGLSNWFQESLRGTWCSISEYPTPDRVFYVIRHGDTMQREPSVEDGRPSSVYFRPELYDVLIYDRKYDELWINAAEPLRSEYRRQFGVYLGGSEHYFPASGRYTLEPLRKLGPAALSCAGVPELKRIHLVEITYLWGGALPETEVRKADDLFAVWAERKQKIPARARINGAKFKVLFTQSKKWRTVTVALPSRSGVARIDDRIFIERWLRARGFVVGIEDDDEVTEPILEGDREPSHAISNPG